MTTSKASGRASPDATTTKPEHDTHEQPTAANYTAGEEMSLAVAMDFADNPRPYHSLACPADTNGELYRALKTLAAAYREAIAASHRERGGQGEAVGVVSEPFGEETGWCAEGGWPVETPLFAAPPSQPADKPAECPCCGGGECGNKAFKPAGQAVTDADLQWLIAQTRSNLKQLGSLIGKRYIESDCERLRRIEVAALAPEPATAGDPFSNREVLAYLATRPYDDDTSVPLVMGSATVSGKQIVMHFHLEQHPNWGGAAPWTERELGIAKATPAAAVPEGMVLVKAYANCGQYADDQPGTRAECSARIKRGDPCERCPRRVAAPANRPADAQRGVPSFAEQARDALGNLSAAAIGLGLAASPADPLPSLIDAARTMGDTGAPPNEAERLAFEAWMQGHCWALCATWRGTEYRSDVEDASGYCPHAARTRGLWAAWRDRAALISTLQASEVSK